MAWDRQDFRRGYLRLAPVYDYGLKLYQVIGMRLSTYRSQAVSALCLQPGNTVVDLGTGTGENLALLVNAVGSKGRVIGVDLSPEMLEKAQAKINQAGWKNVELVESDMVDYVFPEQLDAVLATLALATIPDYDRVVQNVIYALPANGRLACVEMTWPKGWSDWLVKIAAKLQQPLGVTTDLQDRKPADSILRRFKDSDCTERYLGAIQIITGIKSSTEAQPKGK